MATPVFSYGTFTPIFETINIADHTSKKFDIASFAKAALAIHNPGVNYNANLVGFVKYWAASYLHSTGQISEGQFQAYLSGKNKI